MMLNDSQILEMLLTNNSTCEKVGSLMARNGPSEIVNDMVHNPALQVCLSHDAFDLQEAFPVVSQTAASNMPCTPYNQGQRTMETKPSELEMRYPIAPCPAEVCEVII